MDGLWTDLLAQSRPGSIQQTVDTLARTPLSDVLKFVAVLTVVRLGLAAYLSRTPPHLRTGVYGFARFVNELADAFIYAGVFVFMVIRPFMVQAFLIPSGSMWPTLYVNDFIVANKAIYRFSDPKVGDIVVFRPPADAVFDKSLIDADGQVKVDYIKRCVGVPGDLVELRNGVLFRNGKEVPEPFRSYSECTDADRANCVNFRKLSESEVAALTKANFKLVQRGDQVIPVNWTEYDVNAPAPRTANWSETPPYAVAQRYQAPDAIEGARLRSAPAVKVPPGYYLMFGDNRNGSFDSRGWGLVPREAIVGRSEAIWLPLSRVGVTR